MIPASLLELALFGKGKDNYLHNNKSFTVTIALIVLCWIVPNRTIY